MRAIIIAGGSGTRLRPLTYNTPKPMVPFFGKPFLQHQIELLREHGITEIVINLHYLAESISSYFGDGSKFGVKLFYSLEQSPLGTAGAVKNAEEFFDDGPMLVFNGDILTDVDLSAIVKVHQDRAARATLTLIRVTDPTAYGLVFMDETDRIVRFLEKPAMDEATVDTVNAGIYVLDPDVFRYVPKGEAYSFERGLFPLLLQLREPVYGHVTENYWMDIGSPSKYRQAHTDVLQRRVKINLPAKEVAPDIWVGENVDVDPQADLRGPLFLGDNVRIRRKARVSEYSVLASGVQVEDRAQLTGVLVGEGSVIGEDARLTRCIVGSRCDIGSSAHINHDSVLADHSVIGKGTRLG